MAYAATSYPIGVTGALASYDPAIVVAARAVGVLFGTDCTLIVWVGASVILTVPLVSVHDVAAPEMLQDNPVAAPSTMTVNV